ncbi:Rqc2 family fibronectin-binding protein [Lachnoanaerobaculum umeaense]|uniref:Rqc2 homolog RqcH n=1 Tax=Lachnoanaerobaculum umeaense TaxID=617123 RepID=A0A385Q024_9FIRM|nr:NFACT RNA binding domain-containing protein [Lachnoanaerobaculum umeaense]AYA99758.1 fibronectin/fibrinogen-binding protein [Lachnoanaerobaculum umeaense]PZW97760.1 putative ribosome quality control (RQC) complex YloA/Tae2 family protein [Lachnoanaerobaculum umeaense]
MAFDGIVISNLSYELNTNLVGGRISKISMPEENELIFTIKNNAKTYRLLISASASLPLVYLTDVNKPAPKVAPAFLMLLRKYIGTAKITDIFQMGLERILCFKLEHLNELGDLSHKCMYVEIMGKHSNIIFTDENNKIIDSIKRISANMSSLREVLPGREYFLPDELKKKDLLNTELEEFIEILKSKEYALSKSIYMNFAGISPLIAEEIVLRASLSSQAPSTSLSELEYTHLFHTIKNLLDDISSHNFSPNIVYRKEEAIEFSSVKLYSYESDEYKNTYYDSISKMLYDFYSSRESFVLNRQKSSDLRRIVNTALERASKKYDLQEKQLQDADKKDIYRIYGDLLNTYGYSLKGGESSFTTENFYDENKEITIPLDKNKTAKENAKKYYDKYAKLSRTTKALSEEILNTKNDIEHLLSIQTALEVSSDDESLSQIRQELVDFGYIKKHSSVKQKKSTSHPYHYISTDGYDIYVGKNNYQNEELTFKVATGNDWWFHAKGIPGSHVILKSNNEEELPDRVYEEAAALAAFYSKAKDSEKVEVDYIQKKNIKKVAGAAPGFVIYHSNWSMIATPKADLQLVK